MYNQILVTGGAGFIGSNVSLHLLKVFPSARVIAFDNLQRAGAQDSIAELQASGVTFVKGDTASKSQLASLGPVELIVDCAGEPAVTEGLDGTMTRLFNSNLYGALNCLELAKKHNAGFIFLSSSRVYPVSRLNSISTIESGNRYSLLPEQAQQGVSIKGISEKFPLDGYRSIYGATKLSTELLIEEFSKAFEIPTIINRCSVISGPRQLGRAEQGFVTFWMASHFFGKPLEYRGFNGSGFQVRDILHVEDLCSLIAMQSKDINRLSGSTFNTGGGAENSISLLQLTDSCREITGNHVEISPKTITHMYDISCYISDTTKVRSEVGWRPARNLEHILVDIYYWIKENSSELEELFFKC